MAQEEVQKKLDELELIERRKLKEFRKEEGIWQQRINDQKEEQEKVTSSIEEVRRKIKLRRAEIEDETNLQKFIELLEKQKNRLLEEINTMEQFECEKS